jgi:hypothetical protein
MKKTFYLVLLIFNASVMLAQDWNQRMVQYSSTQVYTDEVSTLIDYDNDGFEDILIGNHNLRELFLLRNNAEGLLQLELLTDTLYGVLWLHTLEYNNDGMDDLVIAASTTQGDEFYLCINQGGGVFDWNFMGYAPYEGLQSMYSDDYDNDGDIDIIYDDFANSNVIWQLINNGDDTFTQTYIEYIGQPTKIFGVTDFDQDGDKDLLTTYANFSLNAYILVCEENIGNMEYIRHEGPQLPGITYGVVGNFTNDELPDLILSSLFQNGEIVFYENDGGCEFSESNVSMPFSLFSIISVPHDYDNDGDDDFFATYDGQLKLIKQNANNSFTSQTLISENFYNPPTTVYDMNHDGQTDILNPESYIWYRNGNSYSNDYMRTNYSVGKGVLGQITPDGNPDIIVGAAGGKITVYNQRFDEKMAFYKEHTVTGANITYSSTFRDILAYDREGDGDDDILCSIENYFFWLVNEGETFSQESINNNLQGSRLWIGDLDDDGRHDILFYTSQLKRWEWNPNGNNYVSSNLPTDAWADYTVFDADGDSDQDVMYFGYDLNTGNTTLEYLNNNNGNFTAEQILILNDYFTTLQSNLGPNPPIIPSDMDGDGDLDVVFGSENEDYVAWLRNNGDSDFTPIILYQDFNFFYTLAVGDTDNDGDPDIVASINEDEHIVILKNEGEGNFVTEELDPITNGPRSMHVRDMDNDGDNDIAYTTPVNYRIGWLENGIFDCDRSYSSEELTICTEDSLQFGDVYISNPGLYSDTLTALSGCDSVHVLLLGLLPVESMSLNQSGNVLTASNGFDNYIWSLNGEIISGETSFSIDAADYGTGNYSVIAEAESGCNTATASITVTTIISVENNETDHLVIWPIPCTHQINISSEGKSIREIQIHDLAGKLVMTCTSSGVSQIDVSQLMSGSYQVTIIDEFGTRTVKQIQKVSE